MRKLLKLLGISVLMFSSCADDEQFVGNDEVQNIVMSVENLKSENHTRTILTPTNNGATFKWAENDTVGIFPETGSQIAFPMISGAGTNTATFSGGGWALKAETPYMAYYPMQGKFYLDKENIFVDYSGQSITENGSTEHLGRYDYMVASATTPAEQSNDVNFHFKHLGALVRVKVKMEETSTLTNVTLVTDENVFITGGYVDLTENTPFVNPKNEKNKSNSFTISLNNITVEANQEILVYFWMAPTNLLDKTLKAVVNKIDGNSQEISLTGKNIEAGKTYELTTITIPNNQIWYTNVSEQASGPIEAKLFGGILIKSNTYENGKGIIEFYDDVTTISDGAFEGYTITSITIPNSVTNIGAVFRNCKYLTNVTLSNSLTSIGNYTFVNCSSLTSITIPNSVTSIGEYAFYDCRSLTNITIPNNVTSIGGNAFSGCSSLTDITIPNSVTSIGGGAFNRCSSLTNITIPNSVTKIGSAFERCSSLERIIVESGNSIYDSRENCNAVIETASNTLIAGCKNTIIPNTVVNIGNRAFMDTSIASITIPNSVIYINTQAFCSCSSLKSITIPNSVTSIGSGAFSSCSSLTSISIPSSVTSIGGRMFSYCTSLTSISIPSSVTSIDWGAFDHCSSLSSITIPGSVTSIAYEAFWGCTSLVKVNVEATTPPNLASHTAFADCSNELKIYVPAESIELYRKDYIWKYLNIVSKENEEE